MGTNTEAELLRQIDKIVKKLQNLDPENKHRELDFDPLDKEVNHDPNSYYEIYGRICKCIKYKNWNPPTEWNGLINKLKQLIIELKKLQWEKYRNEINEILNIVRNTEWNNKSDGVCKDLLSRLAKLPASIVYELTCKSDFFALRDSTDYYHNCDEKKLEMISRNMNSLLESVYPNPRDYYDPVVVLDCNCHADLDYGQRDFVCDHIHVIKFDGEEEVRDTEAGNITQHKKTKVIRHPWFNFDYRSKKITAVSNLEDYALNNMENCPEVNFEHVHFDSLFDILIEYSFINTNDEGISEDWRQRLEDINNLRNDVPFDDSWKQ